MFEVDSLEYATLATVSRCGMVWFGEDVVSLEMQLSHLPTFLASAVTSTATRFSSDNTGATENGQLHAKTRAQCAQLLQPFFDSNGLVGECLKVATPLQHCMDFTFPRVVQTLTTLLNHTIKSIIDYNINHPDFPMSLETMEAVMTRRLVLSLIWSFAGDAPSEDRQILSDFLTSQTNLNLPGTR